MTSIDSIIAKYGEPATQAILENWERSKGIRHYVVVSLEQRWEMFMRATADQAMCRAA